MYPLSLVIIRIIDNHQNVFVMTDWQRVCPKRFFLLSKKEFCWDWEGGICCGALCWPVSRYSKIPPHSLLHHSHEYLLQFFTLHRFIDYNLKIYDLSLSNFICTCSVDMSWASFIQPTFISDWQISCHCRNSFQTWILEFEIQKFLDFQIWDPETPWYWYINWPINSHNSFPSAAAVLIFISLYFCSL